MSLGRKREWNFRDWRRNGPGLHGSGSNLLGQGKSEIFIGIHGRIANAHFIVKMRTGAAPAQANIADRVTPADRLSRRDGKAREVPIQSGNPITMFNHHRFAITVHKISIANGAVGRGDHTGSVLTGDVHAAMKSSFTAERIAALAKMSSERTLYRPQSGCCGRSQPAAGARLLQVIHSNADIGRAIQGGGSQSIKLLHGGRGGIIPLK